MSICKVPWVAPDFLSHPTPGLPSYLQLRQGQDWVLTSHLKPG